MPGSVYEDIVGMEPQSFSFLQLCLIFLYSEDD